MPPAGTSLIRDVPREPAATHAAKTLAVLMAPHWMA